MKKMSLLFICLSSFFLSQASINPERKALLDKVFEILEKNVANPAWVESKTYFDFKEDLYSDKVMKMSGEDFLAYFQQKRHQLDFSHLSLYSTKKVKKAGTSDTKQKAEPAISWKELSEEVAYLRVRTFSTNAEPMVKILSEIGTDRYDHLIIDLRDNGGGSLDSPVVLGRFLIQESIDTGVYLSRSWFEKNQRSATTEDIARFPFLKEFTYQAIMKMYSTTDGFRVVLPSHDQPVFKGKIYVLVNSNTASACEPLIDLFQKYKVAALVGTKSAGAMLSGQAFKVNEDYSVFLPISDYLTADGRRIDQVGVTPEHKVPSEQALEYVLNELIK